MMEPEIVTKIPETKLPEEVWESLQRFLLVREDDIALDMENFGDLTGTFFFIIGRRPKA